VARRSKGGAGAAAEPRCAGAGGPLHPNVADALAYAREVLAGDIPAGRLVRLACARFLADIEQAEAGRGAWGWRPDLAENAVLFSNLMPNIKGPEAGRPLRLMRWQWLVFANLFGFTEAGTPVRRFRQAVIYVPRGNGKTSIAAPIAPYAIFLEGEGGAEGYAAAVTRDQARILFDTAREMVRRSPALRRGFGVEASANAIHQVRTASKLVPISSDAKALDGLNVQVAVCDEIAAHKTSEVYDVLLTAMGKRLQPLLLSISTATGNTGGVGKQLWDYAVRVLEGAQEDARLFALFSTASTPRTTPGTRRPGSRPTPPGARRCSPRRSAPSCARPATTPPRRPRPRPGT
jgi:phage terminase large subunit-like protein